LKLPSAGYREGLTGEIYKQGSLGRVWSSSAGPFNNSRLLLFSDVTASWNNDRRVNGFSVRCIKD